MSETKTFKPLKYQIARKHVKNHSKEEQEQVKVVRDSGSQGRSTDTSQEGWLDTEMPPGHQQVSYYYTPLYLTAVPHAHKQ